MPVVSLHPSIFCQSSIFLHPRSFLISYVPDVHVLLDNPVVAVIPVVSDIPWHIPLIESRANTEYCSPINIKLTDKTLNWGLYAQLGIANLRLEIRDLRLGNRLELAGIDWIRLE